MFGLGTTELLVVGMVALLLFGNRLPSVMRSLGGGISEFKKGMDGLNREITRETEREPARQAYSETGGEFDHEIGPQVKEIDPQANDEVVQAVGKE
jgi:sec-independent protein translocase protein TatA